MGVGWGARQTRVGLIRVMTTYAHPLLVILTVLDSKRKLPSFFYNIFFLENLLSNVS